MARKRARGSQGDDLWKGASADEIYSALGGDDKCYGNKGDDTLNGNAGDDTLSGGAGDDTVNGNAGNDVLYGDKGNDDLNGGAGNDKLSGGSGDDNLEGGSGNDTLNGGSGNDFVIGDTGDDRMIGGAGDDVLDWDDGDGNDIMSGNDGRDTIEVDGSVTFGDNFVLGKNAEGKAFFERTGLDGQPVGLFNLTVDTAEIFDVSGDVGNDTFLVNDLTGTGVELVKFDGGEGDDLLDGINTSTVLEALGGAGNDTLGGGSNNDILDGGDGNDEIVGNKGDDRMIGGAGDDVLDWDDGDGNDIMSGNDGRDTIEVDGSVTFGDNFVLGKNAEGKAFFERTGLDGQLGVGLFNLTVDTSEVFDVNGDIGNDTFVINDLTGTGVELVQFEGGEGTDLVDGTNTSTALQINGGAGADTLTGGSNSDQFIYAGDPAVEGTDTITNFKIANGAIDQFGLSADVLGSPNISFQKGNSGALTGNSNILVLLDGFQNAGLAAQAIANNNNVTTGEGLFVYFNTNLGFSRLVHSNDLGNGGGINVLANLTDSTNIANQNDFSAGNFAVV